MEKPVLSIIVPVYKVEKYLSACLDSILASLYKDFEAILIDDGSPDNCGRICDEYARKDSRIRVIHQKNGGLSVARNVGLEIARGEYISFVDSDDLISKDLYSENMPILLKNKEIDILEFPVLLLKQENVKCQFIKREKDILLKGGLNMLFKEMEDDGRLHCYVWYKLYKKKLFSNIRFPVGKVYEDMFIYPQLLSKTNFFHVSTKGYYLYRQRNDSIVHTDQNLDKRKCRLEAEIGILRWIASHRKYNTQALRFYSLVITNIDSMAYLFPGKSFRKYTQQLDELGVSWKTILKTDFLLKDKIKLLGVRCIGVEKWTRLYCILKKISI